MLQRDVGAVTSYAEAVAGGYTGTRAQWRQLLATLPNEPFIAEYNSTSYADVSAALANEKVVFVEYNGGFFPYVGAGTTPINYHLFAGVTNSKLYYFTLTSGGTWSVFDSAIAFTSNLPTKVSDLTNDSGFVTASTAPVTSVNGETGAVVLAEVIFLAHYGTTTLEEVEDALAAGSTLFAIDGDGIVLPYVGDLGGGPVFAGITNNIARTWTLSDISETWSHTEYVIPDTAADLPYVNSASSLDAVNVQEAIDELDAKVSGIDASSLEYDNTTSGLQSGNAQSAIDELAARGGMTVTITATTEQDVTTYTADKSWSSIMQAIYAGRTVFADDGTQIYPLLGVVYYQDTGHNVVFGFSYTDGGVTYSDGYRIDVSEVKRIG